MKPEKTTETMGTVLTMMITTSMGVRCCYRDSQGTNCTFIAELRIIHSTSGRRQTVSCQVRYSVTNKPTLRTEPSNWICGIEREREIE